MLLLLGGSQVAGASGIQRRAGRVWVTIYIVLRYDGRHFATLENSMIELESVRMKFPEDTNIIVGQTHFIKTAEECTRRW
jgi:hypothetical protein